ncbi:MAG: ATP-grasp domain-containing protein [Lachnospiraceae bacterium]|nr:ATP-grasp domain-containing protein [Lachnospiraceae bacterium]
MTGWIIYEEAAAAYNRRYLSFYEEECEKRGIDLRLVLTKDLDFGAEGSGLYLRVCGETAALPDFAICRVIHPLLTAHLEAMGVPVFNNSRVASVCNDKAKTYQTVAAAGIPVVTSRFVKREEAERVLRETAYPCVIKTVAGHGGAEVFLLDEFPSEDILARFRANDSVLQPFTGRGEDLRVYVIGDRIIAAVLRHSNEGFRANYSLGGSVSLYELNTDETALVQRIIDLFDFGLVGIDFIVGNDGELIFNEIEDVVGSRMLYAVSDISVVPLYLDYILERLRK